MSLDTQPVHIDLIDAAACRLVIFEALTFTILFEFPRAAPV